jgi:hypothetical protein
MSRNWGAGGMDSDEFGLLPEKRVESIRGISATSTAPMGCISSLLYECVKQGESPTILRYGGAIWNTKLIGITCKGKYYSLKVEHDKNLDEGDLEMT